MPEIMVRNGAMFSICHDHEISAAIMELVTMVGESVSGLILLLETSQIKNELSRICGRSIFVTY